MTQIIEWANDNQGFLSLAFSVISVFIAIMALRAPYRKNLRLVISFERQMLPDKYGNYYEYKPIISLTAINLGNRQVILEQLCLFSNNRAVEYLDRPVEKWPLEPAHTASIQYDIEKLETRVELGPVLSPRGKWYGYARDSEGKTYKVRARQIEKHLKERLG